MLIPSLHPREAVVDVGETQERGVVATEAFGPVHVDCHAPRVIDRLVLESWERGGERG
ncbi:hypothetical protein B484DRAFT_450143, partial [Ochromonadaceae sp. CCMP2298]